MERERTKGESEEIHRYFTGYINIDPSAGLYPMKEQYQSEIEPHWLLRIIDDLPDPYDVIEKVGLIIMILLVPGLLLVLIDLTTNRP